MSLNRLLPVTTAVIALAAGSASAETNVVASIKPVHSLVAAVMEGAGEPALLVEGAGSPHSYSLKPSQAAFLQDADVVFWVGESLETFLEKPLHSIADEARSIELMQAPNLKLLSYSEDTGHADAAEVEEEDGHPEQDGHDHRGADTHVWLDPVNAKAIVTQIAIVLAEADPDNAALYEENAEQTLARLDDLDDGITAELAPLRDIPFIVFHDAYHYFVNRYGLNQTGALTVSPEVAPGAARVAEIREVIEETGARCVFAEPQFPSSLIGVITEGTGAKTGALDPLGATMEPGPDLYFDLVGGMAASFSDCLAVN